MKIRCGCRVLGLALAGAVILPAFAQVPVEMFEYASSDELAAIWTGSANTVVSLSSDVSPHASGTSSMQLDFTFVTVEYSTETVFGPYLDTPLTIGPEQYLSFRVKGDPAFTAADFRNLYLYAHDVNGNFGRWGAAVPTTGNWQVFNFPASTVEKPWNSPELPDLSQIVRFDFYQYGSEAAIGEYTATVLLDELTVRDEPLVDPGTPGENVEAVLEDFEYPTTDELLAVWTPGGGALLETSTEVAANSPGETAMKVDFTFPSTEWSTIVITGPTRDEPLRLGSGQYLTLRVKGDPAFAAADFRNTYLYAYDSNGNFGRWGSEAPVTDEWKVLNYAVDAIEKPWDSPVLPDLNDIVRFSFFQYGSQAAIPEYTATLHLDDLMLRNTPLTEFPPAAEPRSLIDNFEGYADDAALLGFYTYANSPAATATTASLISPAPQGNKALRLAINFAAGQYPWGSVRSPVVAPFSLPTNATVSLRFRGDPSLAAVADGGTSFWLSFFDTAGRPIHYITEPAQVTSGEWTELSATLADFTDTAAVDIGNLVQWRILVQAWQGTPENAAQSAVFDIDDIQIRTTTGLVVSGTPPAGLTGTPFTNIVVDEAGRTITADLPAGASQAFLTITPGQNITSIRIENGKLVVRW